MRFIAYTTKGLEEIARNEILRNSNTEILDIASKRVIFDSDPIFEALTKLSTIDDIGMVLTQVSGIKDSSQLEKVVDELDFQAVRKEIGEYRKISDTFSLTITSSASPLSSKEIVSVISKNITEKYHWQFTEFDHTNFDIRIFIDHTDSIVSVRLTNESLHNRKYKTVSKPGSLKPTIAAAMVQLTTDFQTGLKIVDNFCGSGTILCESFLAGNKVYGGDIDPESVVFTKSNLKNLHYNPEDKIKVLNAIKTNWQSSFFDCAISNLPWDKQIKVKSITQLYEGTIQEYARILKPNGKLCVLVSKPELFIKYTKKYFPHKAIEQIKIGLLGQNPSIVLVK